MRNCDKINPQSYFFYSVDIKLQTYQGSIDAYKKKVESATYLFFVLIHISGVLKKDIAHPVAATKPFVFSIKF